jgi:sulfur relay (sulfurtransferase) complex TusBCD TusD component (DsrE family)
MKVAYIFAGSGSSTRMKLGQMILPQMEEMRHGVEVVGMFFFEDNTYILRNGDPIGERLAELAKDQKMLIMLCDKCAFERGLAEEISEPGRMVPKGTVAGVEVGCFPDLYAALSSNPPDQIVTL